MASNAKTTGLGALPTGLLRPTTPPEPAIPAEVPADDAANGDVAGDAGGQGGAVEAKPRAKRTKRAPAGGETRGRKLVLTDDIHDRLWLLARQRRQTVSQVAADILDRNLPRFRVERTG